MANETSYDQLLKVGVEQEALLQSLNRAISKINKDKNVNALNVAVGDELTKMLEQLEHVRETVLNINRSSKTMLGVYKEVSDVLKSIDDSSFEKLAKNIESIFANIKMPSLSVSGNADLEKYIIRPSIDEDKINDQLDELFNNLANKNQIEDMGDLVFNTLDSALDGVESRSEELIKYAKVQLRSLMSLSDMLPESNLDKKTIQYSLSKYAPKFEKYKIKYEDILAEGINPDYSVLFEEGGDTLELEINKIKDAASTYSSVFDEIIAKVEELKLAIESLSKPLIEIGEKVGNIKFEAQVDKETLGNLDGVFDQIKENINTQIESVQKVIEETIQKIGDASIQQQSTEYGFKFISDDDRNELKEWLTEVKTTIQEIENQLIKSSTDIGSVLSSIFSELSRKLEEEKTTIDSFVRHVSEALKSINPNEFQNFVSDNIKSIDITKGIESSIEKVKVLKDLVDGINSSAQSSFQILNKTPFSKEYEKESGKLKARQDQADVEYSNTVLGIDRIANLTTDSLGYKIKDKAALKEQTDEINRMAAAAMVAGETVKEFKDELSKQIEDIDKKVEKSMSYQKELDKARGTYVNAKDKMASYSSLIGDWKKEDYENSVFAKQNNSINTLLQSFKSGSITLKDFENKVNSIINSAQKMADAVSNSRKKTDELLTGLKDPLYQSQYADIENQQKQLESSYLNGKITLTEYNREYKSLYKTINDVSKQQQAEYSFQEQINRAYRNSVNVIESYRDLLGDGAVSSQYEILNSNFDNAVQHQDIKEFVNYASSLDEQFSLMSSSIDEVWKSWDRLQESFVGSDWLGNDEFTANVIETGKSISNFANDLLSGNISLTQFSTDSFSAMQVLSKIAHNVEEFYGIFDQDNLIPEFSQAFIDLKDRFDKLNTVFQNGTIDAKEYTEEVQRLLDVASDPKWKASNDKGTLIGSAATREAAINDIKEMAKDLKLVGGRLEAIEENGQVQGFVGQIRVGNNEIQKIYFNLEDIQNGLVGIRQQTSENIHYTSRWEKAIEAIRNRWNQVGTWAASFLSFEKMRSVVRNGIDIIRELDEEYANLLKVSNDSASSIRQFTKDSFDIADRIGSSAKTVQAAAVEWSRLGYSIKEASQLAEASTVFVNVGDGIDAATATKDLVSALAAFHMEASEAMSIVDKLNEIGK